MLSKIVLACIAAVVAYLVCIFVGGVLLVNMQVPFVVAVGHFLESYAALIALLVGLWYFFSGGFNFPTRTV